MGRLTPYSALLPDATASESPSSEWRDVSLFLAAVRRRWRLFAAIVLAFVVFVGIATALTPKTYTTTVRMMAGNPEGSGSTQAQTSLPILNALVLQNGVQSAETFATLVQQDSVASAVANTLGLRIAPAALLGHINVTPTTNTAILNISATWKNPKTSADIANAFANAFIWKERDFVRSQAASALGFLSSEIPHAQAEMQRTGTDLAQFQAANGFVDAGSHTQQVVSQATNIEGKIDTVALDRREAQALLNNATAQLAALPATINNSQQITVNPVLTDLRSRLEQVNLQLAQASSQYTEQHPLVISLKKQRAQILAEIAKQPANIDSADTLAPNPIYQSLQQQIAQYRQRIDGDAAQLALLAHERTSMSPMLQQLPQLSMQLATLQQRAKLASDVYNALEQKYNEATIAKTTAISDISIVQPASADAASVRPQIRTNLLVALVIGIILGLITVAGLEMYRKPVHEGCEGMLGLRVLARIPTLETTNRRMLPWLQSMTLEAFLHLCVSLKLKNKRPLRTLAVTSPSRGDGKSTTAFNLAKAMSNLERRVLLVDADLRRPTIHDLAQCSNKYGLSDVLEGSMQLDGAVQTLSPSFDVLAAGHSVANPVALMQSAVFDEMLREAAERYNIVIVDTSALCAVTDGYLVSAKTEASVLVVSVNTTAEREAREVMYQFNALGIDNLVGIVLNRDRKPVNDYSDYFARRTHGALPGRDA